MHVPADNKGHGASSPRRLLVGSSTEPAFGRASFQGSCKRFGTWRRIGLCGYVDQKLLLRSRLRYRRNEEITRVSPSVMNYMDTALEQASISACDSPSEQTSLGICLSAMLNPARKDGQLSLSKPNWVNPRSFFPCLVYRRRTKVKVRRSIDRRFSYLLCRLQAG